MLSPSDKEIEQALRTMLAAEQKPDTQNQTHPSVDELTAYEARSLASNDFERVQEHLIFCRECSDLLLDLQAFSDVSAAQTFSAEPQTEAAWQDFKHKFFQVEDIQAESPAIITAAETKSFWQRLADLFSVPKMSFAMAAMLLLVSFSLGAVVFWQYRQNQNLVARLEEQKNLPREKEIVYQTIEKESAPQNLPENADSDLSNEEIAQARAETERARREAAETRRVAEQAQREAAAARRQAENAKQQANELTKPQINVPIVEDIALSTRSGETIELPKETRIFTFVIQAFGANFADDAVYNLEITNKNGRLITAAKGLRKNKNLLTVSLTKSMFPAGEYNFKLFALVEGEKKLIREYSAQFRYK